MTLSENPDQKSRFEAIKAILLREIESITGNEIEEFGASLKPKQQDLFKRIGEANEADQIRVVAISKLSEDDLAFIKDYDGANPVGYLTAIHDLRRDLHTFRILKTWA
ncbi:hypothetical protein A2307_00990 [Candidatus Peregrinibacteria bacterium RIFOXYB2_FULL_33_20]|nr:MAG: hypothetical protein A2307_00990 [Candidatus Peregrinibacteria bacterium RIFOXYB2_FULL_33_20]